MHNNLHRKNSANSVRVPVQDLFRAAEQNCLCDLREEVSQGSHGRVFTGTSLHITLLGKRDLLNLNTIARPVLSAVPAMTDLTVAKRKRYAKSSFHERTVRC